MSESTSRVQRVVAIEDLIRADPAVTSLGQFRWRTFLWTLAATLGILVAFWIAGPPTYLTNDDTTIRRDLDGLAPPGATANGYVLFAHSLLGWGVVALQRVVPAHLWDCASPLC